MFARLNDRYSTANARFKADCGRNLCGGILVAVVLHFALFQFFPKLTAADFAFEPDWIEVLQPPELTIPPPPEAISRPMVPKVVTKHLEEPVIPPPTTWEANPYNRLPPPPDGVVDPDGSYMTPYTVKPELKDAATAAEIVESLYPAMLRAAGIGGTVTLEALVDTTGSVRAASIFASSGQSALDEAALTAVRQFEFTPALNRDKKVNVSISLAITFKIR